MSSPGQKTRILQLYRHGIMSSRTIFEFYYEQIMSRSHENGDVIFCAQAAVDFCFIMRYHQHIMSNPPLRIPRSGQYIHSIRTIYPSQAHVRSLHQDLKIVPSDDLGWPKPTFRSLNAVKLKHIKHTTQATPQNTKCLSKVFKREHKTMPKRNSP